MYVGISRNPQQRWRSTGVGYSKNERFYNAIKKYGWDNIKHEILDENFSEEDACLKERELIKYYRSNIYEFGYNCTSGGEKQKTYNKETLAKMSKNRKGKNIGENHYLYHKHLPQATRDKISKNHKHVRYWSNKHRSQTTKDKLSKARSIKVVQLDKDTLEFIKEWNSGKEVGVYFGHDPTGVTKCCKHKANTWYGYTWMYAEEYYNLKLNNLIIEKEKTNNESD